LYQEFLRIFAEKKVAAFLSQNPEGNTQKALVVDQCRKEAMAQIRKTMGRRVNALVMGGATSSQVVKDFLADCFPLCQIFDAYGTTECGSIANTAGYFYSDVKYKLEDVPELSYSTKDLPFPR
jgi:long-subunit acyl-CoA synthetase (AMP-forming)